MAREGSTHLAPAPIQRATSFRFGSVAETATMRRPAAGYPFSRISGLRLTARMRETTASSAAPLHVGVGGVK